MQQTTTIERPRRAGGLLALIGGLVVVISSFISWGKPEVTDNSGTDIVISVKGGGLAIVTGAVLIILGLLLMFVRRRGGRVALGVLTILAGLAASGFALIFITGDDGYRTAWASGCVDNNICKNITSDDLKKRLDKAITSKDVNFDPHRGVGIYIALVGGVIGLVGGIAGLRRGKTAAPSGGFPSPGYVSPTAPAYGQPGPTGPPAYGQPAPGTQPPPATPPPATPPPATPPPQQPPPQEPPGGGGTYQP